MRITITKESDGRPLKDSTLASDKNVVIQLKLQHPNIDPDNYDFIISIKLAETDSDNSALLIMSTGDQGGITKKLINSHILESNFLIEPSALFNASSSKLLFYTIQMLMKTPESIRVVQKGSFLIKPSITEDHNQWISQV